MNEIYQSLEHWRELPAKHQPAWPDANQVRSVGDYLRSMPPLVFAGEADTLKEQIAKAGRGEAFILQGGDCAETFADSISAARIRAKIQTILQMAIILTYGAALPVVKIGRMAGQYAKPRSNPLETRDGVELPSYMGDAVNGHDFTPEQRIPDPERMVDAYHRSATTLNLIRAFTSGGFADMSKVHEWNKGFTENPAYKKYEKMAEDIDWALRFMKAAGIDSPTLRTVDMYSSHEALLLEYETAMTRIDQRTTQPYNTSAHFLWIGERTRDLDGAHVELLSHVRNPIGVKLGPTTTVDTALRLMDKLNPEGEEGRLTFITRMGASKIRDILPALVEGVAKDGRPVTWMTDPMHGNTITASNGYKTRRMEDIIDEVRGFFDVHIAQGTIPGGVHIELTGDSVTEVLGGSEELSEEILSQRYETLVDPRLNHRQSLELAFLVSQMLRDND
ncbi:MAG: 3-deoxy-7-phosphoheptulonate synthase class II [Flaviflexus sp.]|uniref:class II 3-deoxy-7-phosphoheptulonate synthase n=1 Tax=Flaviflexus sp. TaxID=1969482 RepID=UPI00352F0C3E